MKIDVQKQIEVFKDFFDSNYKREIHNVIQEGKQSLLVNFLDLSQYDFELSEQLIEDSEETVKSAEIALEQFDVLKKRKIKVRFVNLPKSQEVDIRNLRSVHLGKLIVLMGIVRQASDVRPQVINARFECPACGNIISILQIEQTFREPQRCSCGRRGRFKLVSKDLVDAQRLVVEESPEYLEGGEQPKRISVFLKGDLVEPKMEKKTTPGSKIKIVGVVKEVPIQLKTGTQSTRYELMVDANSIESLQETYEEIIINEEDEKKIKELAEDPKIYEKLISTIAPSIYGHDDVKSALVLQLMGGVRKERKDGTKTRGDLHILLCGDPGSGKSEILKFIATAAPKARYISGKGVSSAGLTASVVKDEFLRGWALEAGALVLANGGIACLDELDKISSEDTSAMHESMEQQTITIAKANIQATLRSQTTILAAANPKLGRFDPYQLIATQIAMPPALINRFDLIFIIRDLPTRETDDKIATHILEIQKAPETLKHEVPLDLFRKYIAYAKQRVHPKLTDAALKEIKEFYVNLRNMETAGEPGLKPIPITARQLEALVRLAEGSAKVRLSNQVTKLDAKRAINILKHCLMAVGFDYETQTFDIDRISTGIPASQRSRIVIIREIIDKFIEKGIKSIPLDEITAEAMNKGITRDQVEEVIDRLKHDGAIFEPRKNFLSKI
ncbi:minichromosome maintenance protein MCM [Candidatus Woesearchaeota archaeon]|nr:minichromosome maintenance protein MCM [Candidatus Woesearchaeota archaeon]